MTTYKFGDVVLVGFPFTNLKAIKQRPAVIVSDYAYQQSRPDIILMAITSQIRMPASFGEYFLQNWQSAGLLKPSMLKPLLATLEHSRIIRKMGELSLSDRNGLTNLLQQIFGI